MKRVVKKYKAIIFDLDGTLIDSMPHHFKAFKETLKEHGVSMKDATLKHFMGSSTKKILRDIRKVYPFEGKIDDVREERRYHYFQSVGKKNIILPGVEKTIKDLKKSYKLAIATGSSRVTMRYSINKKFQKLFDKAITLNDVKRGKPSPDQLFLASKRLNVKSTDCLMVGDSIYDMISAKKAKMDAIGVLTGYATRKELIDAGAIVVLKDVNQIQSYLNKN